MPDKKKAANMMKVITEDAFVVLLSLNSITVTQLQEEFKTIMRFRKKFWWKVCAAIFSIMSHHVFSVNAESDPQPHPPDSCTP